MKIYESLKKSEGPTAVALGYFDGVHLAHQQVLHAAIAYKNKGLIPTVLTFRMDQNIPKKAGIKTILTDEEKLLMFGQFGIEQTYIPCFSKVVDFDATTFFYDVLIHTLQAQVLVCGFDYAFGKNAQGNVALLQKLCDENHVELIVIAPYAIDGELVSSTQIREYLLEGNIEQANKMLGFPYFIKGQVSYGNQIGKTLGFPTANIKLSKSQVIPKFGVYETTTIIDGVTYKSITNIGTNPTIDGKRCPLSETHIFDFHENLYQKNITVTFQRMLREEQKFASLDELQNAIERDIQSVK